MGGGSMTVGSFVGSPNPCSSMDDKDDGSLAVIITIIIIINITLTNLN